MFQRRTSSRTTKSRQRMLPLQVNSPRILFFDVLKISAKFFKLGIAVLVMVAAGFGLKMGWERLFVENDEFMISDLILKTFDGKEPRFLTRNRLKKETGLDPDSTLFALDTDELARTLESLPELTAARVSRRLPGTLKIEIRERQPVAWVACRSLGILERDRVYGLLVDSDGVPFQCSSEALWEYGQKLPVVMVTQASITEIVEGRPIEHRGLNYALELVKISSELLVGIERPARVMVKDEITLEMKTLGGTLATLSYYHLDRQLTDFSKLVSHARAQGRELEKVNLIPRRFIPVHYRANL